jgi:tRNA pseudouridine38-40 synthase
MPRYQLILAYDGTDFHGWQRQTLPVDNVNAQQHIQRGHAHDIVDGLLHLRTVQETVERAVSLVVREQVELIGASRTDSGVHARGQVAAFSCEPRTEELLPLSPPTSDPPTTNPDSPAADPPPTPPRGTGWPLARGVDRLAAAINSRLPDDVSVLAAHAVPHRFDPVFGAVRKAYSYTYHLGRLRPLWDRRYVHHVRTAEAFDLDAMNRAASILVGEHDFAAFAAAGHGRLTTVRTVFRCEVAQGPSDSTGRRYTLHIEGSGFLWNMVRIIAGSLMQVGAGQRSPEDVARALAARDRTLAGPTIGPEGLCLEWIRYADLAAPAQP